MKLWIGSFLVGNWFLQASYLPLAAAQELQYNQTGSARNCNGTAQGRKCPRPKGEDSVSLDIAIVQPTSLVADTRPMIAWTGDPTATYTVLIYRGGEILWRQQVQGNSLHVGVSLPPGMAYQVLVTSASGEQDAMVFNIASESQSVRLEIPTSPASFDKKPDSL